MKSQTAGLLFHQLSDKRRFFPLECQIDLTYRCSLNCIHCYCKGSEVDGQKRELTTDEFKKILDEIHKEGCLWIIFSGGDPLIREDFLDIYSYAKQKGFLITIFTSGQAFTGKIIDFLVKAPPMLIEITLNGVTKETYETITQVKGSYSKVIKTIRLLAKRKLNLIIKTNCLKQNKDEIAKIKAFTEKVLGKPRPDMHYFQYGHTLHPRLNGDTSVCDFRLSFQELLEVKQQDRDMWQEYKKNLCLDYPKLPRDSNYLYWCNRWMDNFFINPFGRLKFCLFSEKFSIDLKTTPFREGFYKVFPKILDEKFKTDSKCRDCSLRQICAWCPAFAYLETGDEEAPIPYYCEFAKADLEQIEKAQSKNKKPQAVLAKP